MVNCMSARRKTVSFESYFMHEKQFVPASEFQVPIEPGDQIEGAIVLKMGGVEMLDLTHWDVLDGLWYYLAESLARSLETNTTQSFFFPDQPIEVELSASQERQIVELTIECNSRRTATAGLPQFCEAFCAGLESFLERLWSVAPHEAQDRGWYESTIRTIRRYI